MALRGAAAWWRALWEDTRAGLRESPGMRFLLFTTLLSSFVAGLLIPVLPLFLIERGFSLLQLGGLFSLVAVSAVLVQMASGRAPQVFARRDVVVGLQFVTVLTFPAYLVLTTPLEFLAVTAVATFAGAASAPGMQVLVAEAAPHTRRAALFAYLGVVSSLAYAAAVVVGYAVSTVSYAAVLYLGTVASLLSFAVTAWLAAEAHRARAPAGPLTPGERAALAASAEAMAALRGWAGELGRARRGLETLLPRPRQAARNVRWLTLHLFLFGISLAIYPVYFPLYLGSLGLPQEWSGVVIAASWVTFGLCQPIGARYADRTGKHREVIVVSLLAAAALNYAMATGPLAWVVTAWVLLGIADGLGRPVTSALIVGSVTRAGRASAFGWTQSGITAARVAAPYAIAVAIAGGGIAHGLLWVTLTIVLAAVPIALVRAVEEPALAPAPQAQGGAA